MGDMLIHKLMHNLVCLRQLCLIYIDFY